MKVVRTKQEKNVIEVDELRLRSLKIEKIDEQGRISISGQEFVGGESTYYWQYAHCTMDDMPEDLRDRLLEWADGQLLASVQDEVDKLAEVA